MNLYRPDDREEASVPAGQVHAGGPPPFDRPPVPDPPLHLPAAPDVATATQTAPAKPPGQRRPTRTAWLVGAGVTCLAVIAVVLGVRSLDLDSQVSDLTEKNGTPSAQNDALDGKVSELTAESDAIRNVFPISQESLADADLAGTYEILFVPVEGKCTPPTAIRSARSVTSYRSAGPPTATHSRSKVLQDLRLRRAVTATSTPRPAFSPSRCGAHAATHRLRRTLNYI
jgi:hypothetical protein